MSIYRKSLDYYVYAYLRSKDSLVAKAGTPYYIGKGRGDRAYIQHTSIAKTPKDKNFIVILENNLSEIGAYAIERRLIRFWGRKHKDPNGILYNLANGGQGGVGGQYGWSSHSIEKNRKRFIENNPGALKLGDTMPEIQKEKISLSLLLNDYDCSKDEVRNKKISERLSGVKKSKEHKEKIGLKLKGRKPWNKGTKGIAVGSPGKRPVCSCILCKRELGINNITRHYRKYHND
jgi:hypothetical protein